MKMRGRKLPKGFWAGSTTKKTTKKVLRRMKPATKTAIAAIAKRVMHQGSENKFVGFSPDPSVAHNGQIGSGDVYPILPALKRGTNYNERVGNEIRPKWLEYRVRIALNESANLTTPYHVQFWVLTSKRVKSYNCVGSTFSTQVNTNLLLDGGAGATNYDASTEHALYPINKEMFSVLKKVSFKLSTTTAENHNPQTHREFVFRIKCPKTLRYEETDYPENFAPFSVMGWSRDDGITPSPLSTHVTITSWAILNFEDA